MPGYVNYFYKDGKLPAHTKTTFETHEILTIHGIITKNSLLFMHKYHNFPHLIPPSIKNIMPENTPSLNSNDDSNKEWFSKYGMNKYKSTILCKGPLLAISSLNQEVTTPSSVLSLNIYKNSLKRKLLSEQSKGIPEQWPNFILHNTPGLRISSRERKATQFYTPA